MKKFISAVMAALMAVSLCALAACGGDDDKDKDKDKEPVKYTVTYEANGGTGTAPAVESYEEGATVTVKPATTFTRNGYTFKTWNDGTQDIAAGATFKMPAKNVTLKAQWEAQPQLYGVWSFTMDQGSGDEAVSVAVEFTITEGDKDADFYTVVRETMTFKAPEMSATEPMCIIGYTSGTEVEGSTDTYEIKNMGDITLVWNETQKTLKFVVPTGKDEAPIEYPMTFAPLPENVNLEGDYWAEFEEDDEATTLKITGKNAKLAGAMQGEFTLTAIGNYAAAMVEGEAQYILEKTAEGLNVYPNMDARNFARYDFKKGTPPASGTTAE